MPQRQSHGVRTASTYLSSTQSPNLSTINTGMEVPGSLPTPSITLADTVPPDLSPSVGQKVELMYSYAEAMRVSGTFHSSKPGRVGHHLVTRPSSKVSPTLFRGVQTALTYLHGEKTTPCCIRATMGPPTLGHRVEGLRRSARDSLGHRRRSVMMLEVFTSFAISRISNSPTWLGIRPSEPGRPIRALEIWAWSDLRLCSQRAEAYMFRKRKLEPQ